MKKKFYIIGVFIILVGIVTISSMTRIKALEDSDSVTEENSKKSEADLHAQENITIPQMEAYMAGSNYLSEADDTTKITGDTTKEEYQAKYQALNQEQNEVWNEANNFRPETNVVHVSNYTDFKAAFENNDVSKIVLDTDIDAGTTGSDNNRRIWRNESIEIDGQGHFLKIINGSLNLAGGTSGLSDINKFTKNFSDTPLFHMHDLTAINGATGATETANAWAFVNGNSSGEWAGTTNTGIEKGLWKYRIGNVNSLSETAGTANRKNLVRGRMICANRGEISVWGYNTVSTASENFYTGGMTFEPYTYYTGDMTATNYSVIWFTQSTGTNNDPNSTGTRAFDVGEGSFVYLKNSGTGTSYPAIYAFFDKIIIGKNATYNSSTPGSAAAFSVDNAQFIAEEGSVVNLLSRAGGYPTLTSGAQNATNGSSTNPAGTLYNFKKGSSIFIVGSNSNTGVVHYNTTGANNQIILDEPKAFDIRNNYNSVNTTNNFLGDTTSNRGTNKFIIRNSDISIWNSAATMNGSPTYDYMNVTDFQVTNGSANGVVTSSDTNLATQYTRNGYKRISGMNSDPELTWIPVTTADYSQRARILLGYTPSGGNTPFDENGDAIVEPVYADSVRKAYIQFTDTLGNVYTEQSSADTYVNWTKADHQIPGFQLGNKEIVGLPFRGTISGGELTAYRTGDTQATTVIDVTPPEPAVVTEGKVTNATKQLIGKDAEPNAKIYVAINGQKEAIVGQVTADGTWSYDLSKYLTVGDSVQIFLEDNAGKVTETLDPAAPYTNSEMGNINPETDLKYRDATFKAATKYTVEDAIPTAEMKADVVSTGGETTQVGDKLTYKWTVNNTKDTKFDAVLSNLSFTNILPDGLDFNLDETEIMVNNNTLSKDDYTYDQTTRELKISLGSIKAGESVTVEYKTTVEQKAVGKEITNTAQVTANLPVEDGEFTPGASDSEKLKVLALEASIKNPGGSIFGTLELLSAPSVINFGNVKFQPNGTTVNNPTYEGEDLKIKDGRAIQEVWTLYAHLEKELTNVDDSSKILTDAIRYVSNGKEYTLGEASDNILSRKNETADPFNLSKTWSPEGDGFKLEIASGTSVVKGDYEATIVWQLVAEPAPKSP